MAKLTGKVAIVTGASKGIGAAIAEKLAEDGASVVVNYSSGSEGAQAVVSRIESKGGSATAVKADVRQPGAGSALVKAATDAYGKVDILVNNAGVFEFRPLSDVDEKDFDRQFGVNVKGLLFASQAAAAAFGDHGGSIINISSVVSLTPPANSAVYSATKAAVDAITRTLAQELGPRKILVNSVLPGVTETEGFHAMPAAEQFRSQLVPMTPLGRIGEPTDIAGVVSFLASDDARWITGQLISVAGGLR